MFIPQDSWIKIDESKRLGGWLYMNEDGEPDGLSGHKREVEVTKQLQNTFTKKIKFVTATEWSDNDDYLNTIEGNHKERLAMAKQFRSIADAKVVKKWGETNVRF